ncbi:hypothetical protein EI94DRAFT_1810953 [Lactarius quietus]|nr:hypothetical protein EI94DRAFT_1810953 [Lactarius quietus]
MPVNAHFILLLAFVHSSAFASPVPLDSRRVQTPSSSMGPPLGVSNRYHHFANTGDGLELDRRSPPVSALGTAAQALGKRDPPGHGPEAPHGLLQPQPPLLPRKMPRLALHRSRYLDLLDHLL